MSKVLRRNDDVISALPKAGECPDCETSERYPGGQCVYCTREWIKENYTGTEEAKQTQKRYQQSDKGKISSKAAFARRRTRKSKAGGSFSPGEFKELCRHYDCRCLRCGKRFPIKKLEADHVVSVFNGGSSDIENIQPLCKPCNISKGAKNTDYRNKVEWDEYGKPVFWWQDGLRI